MPLFKGEGYKCTPDKAIEYITRPGKALLVSSLFLDDSENYAKQFRQTAASWSQGKRFDERKYYHFKLSCNPLDKVTPEQSQFYAEQLAQELFLNHECVIATHVDTGIVHTHIIVNAVNFETGRKLHVTNQEYAVMKDRANILGAAHGFRELDWRKESPKKVKLAEQHIKKEGRKSWKEELCSTLDKGLAECDSFISLRNYLGKQGIVLKDVTDKTISFVYKDKVRAVRGKNLGADYTKEAIEQQLKQNWAKARNINPEPVAPDIQERDDKRPIIERLRDAQKQVDNREQEKAEAMQHVGSPSAEQSVVHCNNFAKAKFISLTFIQKIRCLLLGRRRAMAHIPFDYRSVAQSSYNIKVMEGTLKFMVENGVKDYDQLKQGVTAVAGEVGKLELRLKQVTESIGKHHKIEQALRDYRFNEKTANTYKGKLLHRQKFFERNEVELKTFAKAQELLRHYGVDTATSPEDIKQQLRTLYAEKSQIYASFGTANQELRRWQRAEENMSKILEDRLPKYRLDKTGRDAPQQAKTPRRNRGMER